jgi:surface protein
MSKITNLIGTTWRLGDKSFEGVLSGQGQFNIVGVGTITISNPDTGEVDTQESNVLINQIAVGYVDNPEGLVAIADKVVGVFDFSGSLFPFELGTYVMGQIGNDVVRAYTVYEFTITGGDDIANPLFIDFINTYGTLVSGGEPPTAEGVKSKLQSLITASNAKTGKSDANLTDAVKTLLEGFGSGEGIFAEEENEHGTTIVLGADLQEKTIDITANGTVEVTPDEGYALKKVTANVDVKGNDKIQRWIELNGNSAKYLFYEFGGTSVDELLADADTSNATDMTDMFYSCKALTSVPLFDTSNATKMYEMFYACNALKSVPLFNTSKCGDIGNMFYSCYALQTVPALDVRETYTLSNLVRYCYKLTECWIRNIKVNFQVSDGSSWGHLLTLESLLHLCKECCKTTSSRKLTMGTANLAKLEGIYVKLIDITDDMRAEDDLIDEKYPFVQCESTDEGAMTIQDYMATKKWSLA